MKVEVRGKNIEITAALKDYATKRLSKLEKYIDDTRTAQVAMSVEGEIQKVEVTIPLNGLLLRGEERQEDMYAAIDLVVDKLEKQLDKYKTKLFKRYRNTGLKQFLVENHADSPEIEIKEKSKPAEAFKVVRTKRFALKPMDEEEAIMQMNLLGHNFFVFFNSQTEEVNVVYKRKNGDYGLIEPEL